MPAPRKPKKVLIQFGIAIVVAAMVAIGAVVMVMSVMQTGAQEAAKAKEEAQKAKEEADEQKAKLAAKMQALEAPTKKQTYKYVVALADIVPGQPITKDMVALQESESMQTGALTQQSDALSKMVKAPILKGETVMTSKLLEGDGFLSISPGMRAMTISADSIGGVGGALTPGVHVDVLTTITDDDKTITKTVLQNVQVISVADESKSSGPKGGNGITLAVTPRQAELMALAQKLGTFHLSLRNFNDRGKAKLASGADLSQLVSGVNPVDYSKKLPKPPADVSMGGMQNVNLTGSDAGLPDPGAAGPAGGKFSMTIYKGPGQETVELSQ